MNWTQVESEVGELASKIESKIDCIVGIARGGLIPSRLLSKVLKVKRMYCLTVEKQRESRTVTTEIKVNLSGKKLLLVEDVTETGRSLDVAKEYLEGLGALVQTCCLYTTPDTEKKPDYLLREMNEIPIFPWD